jgi:hypothetical protein
MVAFEQILIAGTTNAHHLMAEALNSRGIVTCPDQNHHAREQRSQ